MKLLHILLSFAILLQGVPVLPLYAKESKTTKEQKKVEKKEKKTRLLFLGVDLKGDKKELEGTVASLEELVTARLRKIKNLEVLTKSEIQLMLAVEQQKQLLGCESNVSCMAEIGGALGAGLILSGSLTVISSENLSLSMKLIDINKAKVISQYTEQFKKQDFEKEMVDVASRSVTLLFEKGGMHIEMEKPVDYVMLGAFTIGAIALAASGYFGYKVKQANDAYDSLKKEQQQNGLYLYSGASMKELADGQKYQNYHLITLGTGIVGIAVGAYKLFFGGQNKKKKQSKSQKNH